MSTFDDLLDRLPPLPAGVAEWADAEAITAPPLSDRVRTDVRRGLRAAPAAEADTRQAS